ncbi:uroporphyrinogen-III C-methyltransferase [Bacillus sp. ISL-51]|uniref:uroporphyrinogen-III C-methyltransferase n=1 Tax=Bacteria TaxID=2 RepID=UPI001BE98B03|nr:MULTISPECIES: uroporphyrinogen-III C-methyltransferase [Bacteria]MBT2575667.1 uroporphyrinogen-III C-methyltransferase [Bacillus sp. ISL-51]MBT2634618.1 uroporphyrinogen-III C-methyltransferase [Bacillus sp. ISL-26]MBT2713958.1 uroporphyrinogen-III C-methyltransferase [Pseudomonas sp. ISL-88]
MKNGIVYFVGAGPGDPGLITVKGKQALEKADVILYDRLANPKLLEYASPDCRFIYCGKLPDRHFMKQAEINALLIEKAVEGLTVVRLKGGDPSVFGRVGEEADALHQHGIRYEMVPGITSGIAAPLYAGTPVTHRDFASSFAMITAHDKSLKGKPNLDWEGLARSVQTLVFYMGIKNLSFICQQLIAYGKSPSIPVIVIQWGTWGRQRSVKGTLQDIHRKVQKQQITNPAIIVIGDIVNFQTHSWFESKPLTGRHMMVVTHGEDEDPLADKLRDSGADVIEWPKWRTEILPVNEEILRKIGIFEDIFFTSRRAVCEFFQALASKKIDIRQLTARLSAASEHAETELKKRGFLVSAIQPDSEKRLVVGSRYSVENMQKYETCSFYITHENVIDDRFTHMIQRTISESPLHMIICPSKPSVQQLISAGEQIGISPEPTESRPPIVCIGDDSAAGAYGFTAVQEQDELFAFIQNRQAEKKLLHS